MTDCARIYSWVVLLFLIGYSTACVPTRPVTMTETETSVATELITEKEIPAKVFEFSNRIHDSYLDTLSGFFTLQFRDFRGSKEKLRSKGRIMVLDPDSSKVYWDYSLPYNRYSYLQHDSTLIEYSGSGGHFINLESGRRENSLRYHIYHIDPIHNIGMGYRISSTRHKNTLFGFDMKDGKEIWRRPISRDYDWNDVTMINDTTTVLVAGGVHTIDPRDGTGWSYDSKTGKKDYTAAVVGTLAGLAAGLLTGNYVISTGHTLISDMVSNVLIDEESLLLATAEEILKLDYSGDIIWSQSLSQDEASQSYIWEENNVVYMMNSGYAYRGYFKVPFGESFMAAFNKETGNEIYKKIVSDESDDFIRDFRLSGDNIFLLFENRIDQYRLSDAEIRNSKDTESFEKGMLAAFIGYQAFRKDGDNVYYSITSHDQSNNYIITMAEQILVLDYEFNYVETIDFDELFILKMGGEDYFVIADHAGTHSLLLDRELMPLAEIEAAGDVYINGSTLYVVDDRKLVKMKIPGYWSN